MSYVHIVSEPRMYADLYAALFAGWDRVEVVDEPGSQVDVFVIVASEADWPPLNLLPPGARQAKTVVFAPKRESGWVRLPGQGDWERIQPFGLRDLLVEVQAGRERSRLPAPRTPEAGWVVPSLSASI